MNTTSTEPERLAEMPLWRLLVLLADIEREFGASTPTAHLIARLVDERLRRAAPKPPAAEGKRGWRHAD